MKLNNNQIQWARYIAMIADCNICDVEEMEIINQLTMDVFCAEHCNHLAAHDIYSVRRALMAIATGKPCPF